MIPVDNLENARNNSKNDPWSEKGVMLIPDNEDDAVDVIGGLVEQASELASQYRDFIIRQLENLNQSKHLINTSSDSLVQQDIVNLKSSASNKIYHNNKLNYWNQRI